MKRFRNPMLLVVFASILLMTLPQWNRREKDQRVSYAKTLSLDDGITMCLSGRYVPKSFLEKPIGLKKGIGQIDFPIQTSSKEAQAFFNQGMAFLYSFEFVQASRSFHQAKMYDSTAAMIYFGLSNTYKEMEDTANVRVYATKAYRLATQKGTLFQKALCQLNRTHLTEAPGSEANKKKENILQLTDALVRDHGTQPEAWMMAARMHTDYRKDGDTERNQNERAAQCYKQVLNLKPQHFGAWHMLIHTYENLADFDACLRYGELYAKAVPMIPHAWHMYAHNLMKTGKVDEAIAKFNHAFELEALKYKTEGMPARYDWHHTHNLELLAYCYQYTGQLSKAEAIFVKLDTITPFTESSVGGIRKGHPEFLLQVGRYTEAIRLAQLLKKNRYGKNIGYSLSGFGYLFNGDTVQANREANVFLHRLDSIQQVRMGRGQSEEDVLQEQSYPRGLQRLLKSGIALQSNPFDQALQQPILQVQEAMLTQTGPDAWISALYSLQLLTHISYRTGNMDLAESCARAMLKHDPDYGGSHWWLARVLHQKGEAANANAELQKAKTAFRNADDEVKKMLKL